MSSQQPPYGPSDPSQPQQGYGQPAYGQPASGQPAYGQTEGHPAYGGGSSPYAHWIKRVASYLIDGLIVSLAGLPAYGLLTAGLVIGTRDLEAVEDASGNAVMTGQFDDSAFIYLILGGVAALLSIAVFVWNSCLRQGRTGYSIGKGVLGIKLVKEATGQPVGAGMAFLRYLLHIVDGLPCYLGYLWPLWDSKRQTFSDKIVGTVVLEQPKT